MKQIIPIKKDILFKTKIGEITNISLDKKYKIKDDLIDGYINIYGTYKMTEASVLEEEFNYKIPFGVSISKNILKDSIKIEVDDFNYKFNKDVLSVNIDLELECDEQTNELNKDSEDEEDKVIEVENNNEENNKVIEEESENIEDNSIQNNINIEENINNITNIINNEEKYYTYKVYIVRQGDTIESICNKYNVTLEDLKEYNDVNNLNIGDKLIIPYIDE